MTYPRELPVFRLLFTCGTCNGLHVEGAPTQYGGKRIDVGPTCVGEFEPFDLKYLEPLTKAARDMYRLVRDQ